MQTWRRDPSLPAVAACAAGILAGFVGIVAAWSGASLELFGQLQTSWVVSGGLGGVTLVGLSAVLLVLTLRRRAVAREVVLLDEAERVVLELLAQRRSRP